MKSLQDFINCKNVSTIQENLLISLQKEVEKFCKFSPCIYKTRTSIKGSRTSNICVYELKSTINGIEVSFNLCKNGFSDPRDLIVDTEPTGTRGKRSSIFLTRLDDVEYVADLIKQSYEKNK